MGDDELVQSLKGRDTINLNSITKDVPTDPTADLDTFDLDAVLKGVPTADDEIAAAVDQAEKMAKDLAAWMAEDPGS